MSKLNRKQLKKLLLKEFKMMGMAPMSTGMIGHSPYHEFDKYDIEEDHIQPHMSHGHGSHKGALSMEDCCKAVLCLIECCDCESTKQKIRQCCEEILSGC